MPRSYQIVAIILAVVAGALIARVYGATAALGFFLALGGVGYLLQKWD
jgi:hypothetical protein